MIASRSLAALLVLASTAQATRLIVTVPASTPTDAAVYLAGSSAAAGSWSASGLKLTNQDDGTFVADVDGPIEFKITRGTWQTVEKDAAGNEVANRRLEAGAAELRVTVARWAEGNAAATRASTVVGDLRIEQVGGRTIRVWLPPGYAAGETRYPVLYLHDGQNCFDAATSAFGVEWQIDESVTRIIAAKEIPPLIVVGIDNSGAKRIDEYTPTRNADGKGGDGEAYAWFVVDVVKRHVDQAYRTRPDRQSTFVGGSSLGGLISLDMIRRSPDVFGGALVFSPSLWWNGEALTAEFERNPLRDGSTVIVTMGAKEGGNAADWPTNVSQAERLARALQGMPIRSHLTIDPAGEHNEAAWARQFPAALQLLLKR